ncbi:MAG: branched-chain amino acid ABC transporter permease [Gammaproteobacteria bacterium]|nr:branched-chain amino acid ABC transporter permease [Gammaproteobacteria bacterium]
MEYFLQQALNALSTGGEYALLALGLAIVFSVMGLVNFAHGETITIGGYTMYALFIFAAPTNAWVLLPIGILAAVAASLTFERVAFRPVRNAPATTGLLTAFGVSIIIKNFFVTVVATRPKAVPTPDWLNTQIPLGPVSIQTLQVLEAVVTFGALIILLAVLRGTTLGLSMRAAAKDFNTVRLMGIRANQVVAAAFFISGLLAGLAAIFIIARRGSVDPFMGFIPVLKAFVAAVIGGFGSLPGAVIGGFVLGITEVVFQVILPDKIAGYRDAFVFTLVGMLLIMRPQGIYGQKLELGEKGG